MNRLSVWAAAVVLAAGLAGCDGGAASTPNIEPTKDGRPPGFEDMMKDMEGKMKNPSPKAGAAAKSATPDASKAGPADKAK